MLPTDDRARDYLAGTCGGALYGRGAENPQPACRRGDCFVREDPFHDPRPRFHLAAARPGGHLRCGGVARCSHDGADTVELSPAHGTVPKGQQPKHHGEHLERNAGWFYRHIVAAPPVPEQRLAEEYAASRRAENVALGSKEHDHDRRRKRADTKVVRDGIRDAKRLLELTVLAQQLSLTR